MKKFLLLIILSFFFIFQKSFSGNTVLLDVVFCMDLSGSTNGLLLNIKEKFWHIVNQSYLYTPAMQLRLGIVAYSRPSYGKNNYYVKVISDLTDDYDCVANELLSIKTITEQGLQYVGNAVDAAVTKLNWSKEKNAVKIIFVIGNGGVNRGGNEYIRACENAVANGIVVNALFCKTYTNMKEIVQWQQLARLGNGSYYEININKKTFVFPTACDDSVFRKMNDAFNKTYIYYNSEGQKRYSLLCKIDTEMQKINTWALQSRVLSKVYMAYQIRHLDWDLVDLSNTQFVNLSQIDNSTLPEEIKTLSIAELELSIDKKWSERRQLMTTLKQQAIQCLKKIKEKYQELKINDASTLSSVVIDAVNKTVTSRGIRVMELK